MAFDPTLWQRFEISGVPVYIRGDRPDWFVPNAPADQILNRIAVGEPAGDIDEQLLVERLPDQPLEEYRGRGHYLSIDSLKEIWFHITNRCNMFCTHCLFSSSSKDAAELPGERVLDLARQASGLGARVFVLTGGEPFVHKDFNAIVSGLLDLPGSSVVVLTNATRVKDHAEQLKRWAGFNFYLQVSIDGLEANHDRIRGSGAYETHLSNIRWLNDHAIPFTLSMCVNKYNVADMPGVIELAAQTGVPNVHFMWYFIKGRGTSERFASPELITPYFVRVVERADALGVGIDNIDTLKTQVFAPAGTRHDGTNSAWESIAVGPDDRLYPTPALIGEAGLATPINDSLERAWKESPSLSAMRNSTAAHLDSAFRFILGGGDPDHSYKHTGRFTGGDPYLPMHEQMALWLIAREAAALGKTSRPGLVVKMGEILESCGSNGAVALGHSNCLLALAGTDSRTIVKRFYSAAAEKTQEDILNPITYPEEMVRHIQPEFRKRSYGCGSPILEAAVRPGDTVLDLGSGTGIEVFIAAQMAGPTGKAIGVDMLDNMLAIAEQARTGVCAHLGYDNVDFRKGYLEDLPVEDNAVDIVISNCVINLTSNKRRTFGEIFRVLRPGGRLVVSDVVCETDPGAAIRNDDRLHGECIAGAMMQKDLFGIMAETGLTSSRVLKRYPYRTVLGHPFFSLTFEAAKPMETGFVKVMYRGPFPALVTPSGTILPVGTVRRISQQESLAVFDDMFVFDTSGSVTNADLGDCACCAPPESGPSLSCGCTPEAVLDPADGRDSFPASEPSCDCAAPPGLGPGSAESVQISPRPHHTTKLPVGCMVCGAPLVYLHNNVESRCVYCGRAMEANAHCENGHFVCDTCHAADAMAVIEHICLHTAQTDMTAILQQIRSHAAIPVNGPEHHAMVPGIILAAYRNAGGEITADDIRTGIQRGAAVPGGNCGFWGVCGAAVGVGTAFAVILKSTPLKATERKAVQQSVLAALTDIASLEAARCCQRDAWLALRKAAELSKALLPIEILASGDFSCRQMKQNAECLGLECPLFPAGTRPHLA